MSDNGDDSGDARLIPFPGGGDASYVPPPIPTYTDTLPPPPAAPAAPPESLAETTLELPPIARPMDPRAALSSEGVTTSAVGEGPTEEGGESGVGDYVHRRSLADRIGDWLEYRITVGQARLEAEKPFREAEIAQKTARLKARTEAEGALADQNSKLRQARLKAQAEQVTARGKANADQVSARGKAGGGMGAEKGRSKPDGSGAKGKHGKPDAFGKGSWKKDDDLRKKDMPRNKGKGDVKGFGEPSGGRKRGLGSKDSSGGLKGPHRRSGDFGAGKADTSGAPGKGSSKRDGLSKDGDRAGGSAKKAERRAKKKERRKAAADAPAGRTTLAAAVGESAQERWGKRRAEADAKRQGAKDGGASKSAPKSSAGGLGGKAATEEPRDAKKGSEGPSGGSAGQSSDTSTGDRGKRDTGSKRERLKERLRRMRERAGHNKAGKRKWQEPTGPTGPTGPVAAESVGITVERPDRPGGASRRDTADRPPGGFPRPAGLPRAVEPHTTRPGTTRPTAGPTAPESSVKNTDGSSGGSSGQDRLAAQHRTDIDLDRYLMDMANIAVAADTGRSMTGELILYLQKVLNAVKKMTADLAKNHNIDSDITNSDLADAAENMVDEAIRLSGACWDAAEASRLAAACVADIYGEDMDAKQDAGVKHASAAAHHD